MVLLKGTHRAAHHPRVKSGFELALPHAPVLESGLVIMIRKSECRGSEVKDQWSHTCVSECFSIEKYAKIRTLRKRCHFCPDAGGCGDTADSFTRSLSHSLTDYIG